MELDYSDLYGIRTLVFQETEPQSNKYYQVILNQEEFKRMSLSLGSVVGEIRKGIDAVQLKISEETYDLPDLQEAVDE